MSIAVMPYTRIVPGADTSVLSTNPEFAQSSTPDPVPQPDPPGAPTFTAVTFTLAGGALNGGNGNNLVDGNTNSFVRFYGYAAEFFTFNLDTTSPIVGARLTASRTGGYSFETGFFGGEAQAIFGSEIVRLNIDPALPGQFSKTVQFPSPVTVSQIQVGTPVLQRVLIFEIEAWT